MVMTAERPAYYTADEVAQELRVTPRTILRLIERGDLRAVRVGKQYRIPRESLEAFLKQS